ncbi:MAG TPA: DmsC/YnfH family molybdoenzyme membrane anchor subunit [Acidimicrobiales bacterium]|nr:DmsC/YnfH family molybdoenzyme membrane anchor subunit [Acidimicrobiales bacterium]
MTLTAVDTFARQHEEDELPANARYYRDLIPLARPAEGEQYAFEVDLDACTGCKSCVVACHSLNGLDDDESWRSVGLLQGGGKIAFQQTVTTACHHCVEPACLTGCPVNAYEKDEATGIVSHLDDQCIGCSYCTLTCPYEVPRFNEARGIVRKCDMCRGRLEVGEAPACVQSCPSSAIRITIVDKSAVAAATSVADAALVPGAPPSALTAPTTTYRTTRAWPEDVRAADHFSLRPSHPHPPLAAMLVLSQLAVGAVAVDVGARALGAPSASAASHAVMAASVAVVALVASTLHLGRPRYAFRAVLGISHSWLSREVVAFAGFGSLAPAYAVGAVKAPTSAMTLAMGGLALLFGIAGVACSVMLYAVTGRAWWQARRSSVTFAMSGVATGALATMATSGVVSPAAPSGAIGATVILVMSAKLAREGAVLRHLPVGVGSELQRSALLLRRDLWGQFQLRCLLGGLGGIAIPAVVLASRDRSIASATATVAALLLLVGGELLERHLFFRVAVAPRMPGELR